MCVCVCVMFISVYSRRSWIQFLENRTIPVLATIVAYLDSCSNLDHMYNRVEEIEIAEPSMWIQRAWLAILNNVCNVSFGELLSRGGLPDMDKFTVACPAAGNKPFTCKLPFPWIVWELVNKAICESKHLERRFFLSVLLVVVVVLVCFGLLLNVA